MGEKELGRRINDFMREMTLAQNALIAEVAKKIQDRLVLLYQERNNSGDDLEFEAWLSGQFEYDNFYVFNVFEGDEELKNLVGYGDTVSGGIQNRYRVSDAVNGMLREDGLLKSLLLDQRLNDIKYPSSYL